MGQNKEKKEIRNRLTLQRGDSIVCYDNVEEFSYTSSGAGQIVFFTVGENTECWCDTSTSYPRTPPVGTKFVKAVSFFTKLEYPAGYAE